MTVRRTFLASTLIALLAANACSDDTPAAPDLISWPTLECDPLVAEVCGFPYPNNVFSAVDTTTPTGRRLALSDKAVPAGVDKTSDPTPFNLSDGFSASTALYAYLPDASNAGMPTPLDIDTSLTAASPTLLLNAKTGELVPHYADLDRSGVSPTERSIVIHPAVRLDDNTRYIVALQDIRDSSDKVLPATAVFEQLRSGAAGSEPSVETRRRLYQDIFEKLAAAGIAQEGLQLAWDFTTASRRNNTQWMVHMRDDAFRAGGRSWAQLHHRQRGHRL